MLYKQFKFQENRPINKQNGRAPIFPWWCGGVDLWLVEAPGGSDSEKNNKDLRLVVGPKWAGPKD
jgi:hypothetical protein